MKRINYRHFICVAITLGFLACSVFVFPHALGRLIEGFRDLGLSAAYYFCELCEIPHSITPTVNDLPKLPFFEFLSGHKSATITLPGEWQGFTVKWGEYWQLWANKENFFGYLNAIAYGLAEFSRFFLLIGVPLIAVLIIMLKRYLMVENNDYDKDSRPLQVYKRVMGVMYHPVKKWIIDFLTFVKERKRYWSLWLFIWAWNFNFIAILIEFFAYYFYFVITWDVGSLYIQFYKLFLDLWAVFNFVPVCVWFIVGYYVLNAIAYKMAYQRLSHRERRNLGFLNERGYVNTIYGYIGAGKTSLITDMALSYEVQFLYDAYEIILEADMHFPEFPWINFENWLKMLFEKRVIYDVWSCRRLIRSQFKKWNKQPCRKRIFGYDYELYGLNYNDNLKLINIWEALEDYACAYLIYTVQSSYIISNYSIRSDKLIDDIGNFPLWNTDFFKRDSRLIDSFSRHSHILDFNMLRLGTKMLKDNPNRNAFGFGIYVISEVDKERKNTPELQGVDRKAAECNQKNDMFNACLKMSRHACVIANRVFVRIVCDLQRTGSLNSDMLELGDTLDVFDKNEMQPLLPFFAPFWIFDLIYRWVKGRFDNFYSQYRHNRADNTLFLYLYKGLVSKMSHYHERIENLFGSQTVKIRLERGFKDGEVKDSKWFRQPKKIYSKRYSTDCMSAIFEHNSRLNTVGIDDSQEYADIMATNEELLMQHSHFQNELNSLKQMNQN